MIITEKISEKNTPPVSNSAETHHILALDGLRGLAVLLVMGYHMLGIDYVGDRFHLGIIHRILSGGWIGVDIFFVLSGYLITGILFDTTEHSRYFRNFYARRFLRIFPLYYGFLLLLVVLTKPLHIHWDGHLIYFLTYTQNLHRMQWDRLSLFTGHFWSLAIEEQFYLVWPLVVFLVRDRRRLMTCALALAASAFICRISLLMYGASFGLNYSFTLCRMDSLLIGAWLVLALRGRHKHFIVGAAKPVAFLSLAIFLAIGLKHGTFSWWSGRLMGTVGFSSIAIGAASLLVLSLQQNSAWNLFFCTRIMRWLGRYSYGIYIFHFGIYQTNWEWLSESHTPYIFLHRHHLASRLSG